jgi:hypothetical protein
MGLYTPTDIPGQPLNTIYAEDINQLVNVLNALYDAGLISFLPPITNPASAPSVALQSGPLTGSYRWGFYWITGILDGTGSAHITGRTLASPLTTSQSLSSQQGNVSLPNGITIPIGVIGWGVVRNKNGSSTMYIVPGSEQFMNKQGAMPSSFTDNVADSSLTTAAPSSNSTGTFLQPTVVPQGGPVGPANTLAVVNGQLNLSNGTQYLPVGASPLTNPLTYAL